MAATEEYMKDPPDMGIYTHDWAIDNAVSDAHYADLEFKTATFLGQDIMLRDYNKKTNTLTYLVSMHADINLLNRPCTLVISDLYAEDLLATYSQPEVDDGFEPICSYHFAFLLAAFAARITA